MVAPVRDFGNKFFSSSLNIYSQQTSNLPTVSSSINIEIDILIENIPNNYDKMRDRTFLPKIQFSRESSMSSIKSSVVYHKK